MLVGKQGDSGLGIDKQLVVNEGCKSLLLLKVATPFSKAVHNGKYLSTMDYIAAFPTGKFAGSWANIRDPPDSAE